MTGIIMRYGRFETLIESMDEGSVDLIATDPPYPTISGGKGGQDGRPSGMLTANDGKIFKHNEIKISEYMPGMFRVLKSPGQAYIMSNLLNLEVMLREARQAGFKIHNLLVWKKNNCTPSRWYMKNIEYILFLRKGSAFPINNPGSKMCLEYNNPRDKRHPVEKPVGLMEEWILNSTEPGDLVFDPFAGAGSTGTAAFQNGRKFLGFESDRSYYEVACHRLGIVPEEDPLYGLM